MKEHIILSPTLNGNELLKNLAWHGVNCINTRVVTGPELARIALMRSGKSVTEAFVDSRDEVAIVAEVVEAVPYFRTTSYSDVRNLASAIKRMRCLVASSDESSVLKDTLFSEDVFIEKNEALLVVYDHYMQKIREMNGIDSVMLIRKAIAECSAFDAEFYSLEEFQCNPLEQALLA